MKKGKNKSGKSSTKDNSDTKIKSSYYETWDNDFLKTPYNFPMPVKKYTLYELNVVWSIYGGSDFDESCHENKNVTQKKSVTSNMSITYKQRVSGKRKENVDWKSIGGEKRNTNVLVKFELSKAKFSHEEYPLDTVQASRQVLVIPDIVVRDGLQCSKFKYMLHSPVEDRNTNEPMILVKAVHVRPEVKQGHRIEECSLRMFMLPLKVNIDQETMLFVGDFFAQLAPKQMIVESAIDSVNNGEQSGSQPEEPTDRLIGCVYFSEVVFSPSVQIKVDYKGKTLNGCEKTMVALLLRFAQLNGLRLTLMNINYRFV